MEGVFYMKHLRNIYIIFCFLIQTITRRSGGWGWEWKKDMRKYTRPIRTRNWGLDGQEIAYKYLGYERDNEFSVWRKKITSWLIWGYWEGER